MQTDDDGVPDLQPPLGVRGYARNLVRAVQDDAPLAALLAAMLVLGIVLRVYNLGSPAWLKWDEHHYVNTARSYLANQDVPNDHPPLGKLIVAASMKAFGDRPVAWRLPALLAGFLNIWLIGVLARRVFGSRRAAWIAAAFVAADGFFIAYSRAALPDGIIVALSVGGMLSVIGGQRVWHAAIAGLCVGCATALKLNGLVFVAATATVCLASRPLRRWTPVLLASAALAFYLVGAIGLINVGRSGTIMAVIKENREMLQHHLSFTVVNPQSSHWYTWFLPLRPIFLRRDEDGEGMIRALLTLGNPILWWVGSVAVIVGMIVVVRTGPRRLWQQIASHCPETPPAPSSLPPASPFRSLFHLEHRAALVFWLLAGWAGPIVFWIPSLRDSYIYHYMPPYAFALALLAGFMDRLYQHRPVTILIAIAIIAEVSVFYAPLWGELPISEAALNGRLLPIWR